MQWMRMSLIVLLASQLPATGRAQDDPCGELWVQRNNVYKEAGYCFRTSRAIRAFGNAGCRYDSQGDVPLTANQRDVIGYLVQRERMLGCR